VAVFACDLGLVQNCLVNGGNVAGCYNNTGCTPPPQGQAAPFSDTTDFWPEDGVTAHAGNITENTDPPSAASPARSVPFAIIAALLGLVALSFAGF
jgi:hypothetical protein